ncbi:MAG: hypothetical protein P8P88_09560, partial [Polaribacter sp.]|nr:hypothetical protein [Polaribacter sp.]
MKYSFVIFLSLLIVGYLNSTANQIAKTEESFNTNSSVFFVANDSLLKINYTKVKELKDDEKYVKALKYALKLLD